jgi:aminoglycoside 2''-phosphotransferase
MPDHDLTRIERALQRLFPDLEIVPIRELETGFGSLVVETRDGVIFRVARHARAAEGHARGVRLLPVLGPRLPVRVPQPEWRVEPGSPDFPFGAIGYRKLVGAPLTPGWLARHDINQTASEMAAFLVALHRVPLEAIEEAGLARPDGDGNSFAALRRHVMPVLRDLLTPTEYRIVSRWSEDFLSDPTLERFGAVLRHGDLWFGNVLVDEGSGSVLAVLDWTNAAIGDPAKDLARQLHLGKRFAASVLQAYEARGGNTGPTLRHRIRRHWELLEFVGIRTAVELNDPDELNETVEKLRAGPILAAHSR